MARRRKSKGIPAAVLTKRHAKQRKALSERQAKQRKYHSALRSGKTPPKSTRSAKRTRSAPHTGAHCKPKGKAKRMSLVR